MKLLLCFVLFLGVNAPLVSAQSGTTPQEQAEDIIHHVLELYDIRMASVNNYTVLVKNDMQGSVPAIEYYERVEGEYAVFRLVPPEELARGDREQVVEGVANVVNQLGGLLGVDASDASEQIRGLEFGNDDEDGGIETHDILNIVADHATSIDEYDAWNNEFGLGSVGGFIITADVSDNQRFAGQASLIRLFISIDYYITGWNIFKNNDMNGGIFSQVYKYFGRGEEATIHEPTCIIHVSSGYPGVPDVNIQTSKTFLDVNQGPPSEQRKAEILANELGSLQSACVPE